MQKERIKTRAAPPPPKQETKQDSVNGWAPTGIPIDGAERLKQMYGDGWQNLFRGTGISGRDPRVSTTFGTPMALDEGLLNDLYRGEGVAKRIVDLAANDMIREWFTINNDTDGAVVAFLDDLKARDAVLRAIKWARLHGGSIVVMGIDDGGTLEEELNEEAIKELEFLKVFERPLLSRATLYDDPENKKFGQTALWQVNPISGTPFKVHETRVLEFDGIDVPQRVRSQRDGWGDSVLQAAYTRIRGLADSYGGVEQIIAEFIIGVLTIDNLQELIAAGREDEVRKRLTLLDLSKHILNSYLVDKEEKYTRISASAANLDKLLDKLEQALSTVTGYPVTLLMGQSPAGLSATGASDIRFYYDDISAKQETSLRGQLERLALITMLTKQGPTKGVEVEDWALKFVPLWQPTEAEVVKMRNQQSETDKNYIEMGALEPAEVAVSRFGGEEYSIETTLSEEKIKALKEGPADEPIDE